MSSRLKAYTTPTAYNVVDASKDADTDGIPSSGISFHFSTAGEPWPTLV